MKKLKYLAIVLFSVFCLYGCGNGSNNNQKPVSSGEYKTIDGSANQDQYQGSKDQQEDLDAIDAYAKDHPDF